jgi:NodT family efflux transporter outer membrane factor (OMF) lipoprotein
MPRLSGSPPSGHIASLIARRSPLVPLLASVLMFGLFSGCSLVPAYKRPDAPTASVWSSAAQASLADAVPVRSGWWRSYRDPALNALVERSLQHNFSLASALANVAAARANVEKAGAPLYPALTLNGTFNRSHQSGNSSGSGSSSHGQSLFAQAGYEIDFWGLNAANADSAQMLARATGFDRDTVALTLTAAVVDTWFQIQSQRQRVALARTIAEDAAKILTLLQAQEDAGVATQLQVEQQRNALATFQAAIPALQQQLDENVHLLATLIGAAPEALAVADADLVSIPIPQPLPNLPSSLLDTRPDIRSMEARLQAANYSVGAARAAFFPSMVLTADGGLSSSSLSRFLASPVASVAASLAAPIFDGGALRGQLHASQAAVAKAVADYRQSVVSALQDVEDSLSAAALQRQVEIADQAAADAARKAATLADAQYRLGTIDFLTVLDTQRTLYQAEDALVQTRLARLQASVSLFRAFGGGFGLTGENGASDAAASRTAVAANASPDRESPSNPIEP